MISFGVFRFHITINSFGFHKIKIQYFIELLMGYADYFLDIL